MYAFRTEELNDKTGTVVRQVIESSPVFVFEAHANYLANSMLSLRFRVDLETD